MRRSGTLLLAATAVACGSPSESNDSTPRILIQAGAGTTDTIGAEPVQALVVRITPVHAGTVVRFEQQGDAAGPIVTVSPLSGLVFGPVVIDTTDAVGKASARLKLGNRVGAASLRIVVPELGLAQPVSYTILPGAPAAIALMPRDTLLLLNTSFSIRGGVTDRHGNDRPEAVVFTAQTPPFNVSGRVVTAVQAGFGRIIGRFGALADTIFAGTAPGGTLSALNSGLVTVNTDGSNLQRLSSQAFAGFTTDWSPDGQTAAADEDGTAIRVFGADGSVRHPTRGGGAELYPEFSADGQWLYYSNHATGWQIRRVHPDGSGDELVLGANGLEVAPALSPDGTRMAYTITGSDQLWIKNFDGSPSVLLATNGHTPAWSPSGDLIAFNASLAGQQLWVITPAGTGLRQVSAPGVSYNLGIDWSPDGKWLIARAGRGTVDLIEVSTAVTISLPFAQGWTAPAWKN